jgi:hypothetical protein
LSQRRQILPLVIGRSNDECFVHSAS